MLILFFKFFFIYNYIFVLKAEFESIGVECDVAGLGKKRIYGTLAQLTGDNLALNQMIGIIESFSGDYWLTHFNFFSPKIRNALLIAILLILQLCSLLRKAEGYARIRE